MQSITIKIIPLVLVNNKWIWKKLVKFAWNALDTGTKYCRKQPTIHQIGCWALIEKENRSWRRIKKHFLAFLSVLCILFIHLIFLIFM